MLFNETITGLVANELYSWRARALYVPYAETQPGVTPIERPGPWFRLQSRGAPGDIRTVPEPSVGLGILIGLAMIVLKARRD